MKRIILLISVLYSLSISAQYEWYNACIAGNDWPQRMVNSYVSINSHGTFTKAQKDTMRAILSTPWVIQTFGVTGLNKQVCDFFLFFNNTNTTTALTTSTTSKTGNALWWWFGRTKTYDRWNQNNIPADTCKRGWVCIFITDNANKITHLGIAANSFSGVFPSLAYCTNLINLYANTNAFSSTLPSFSACTNLELIYAYTNSFNGTLPSFAACTKLTTVYIAGNSFSGTLPSFAACTKLTYFNISTNSFSGETSDITSGLCTSIYMSNNGFNANGAVNFSKAQSNYSISNNSLPTSEVNEVLLNMDTWFVGANIMTANCTVSLSGASMGIPTGGSSNTNLLSLVAKATAQGKTWIINVRT